MTFKSILLIGTFYDYDFFFFQSGHFCELGSHLKFRASSDLKHSYLFNHI